MDISELSMVLWLYLLLQVAFWSASIGHNMTLHDIQRAFGDNTIAALQIAVVLGACSKAVEFTPYSHLILFGSVLMLWCIGGMSAVQNNLQIAN